MGSADWWAVKEDEAFAILNTFISLGGNFIDTADVYGMGISEQVIGRFLKTFDEDIFVATKLGRRQDGNNGWPQNFSYELMRLQTESSLKNLELPQLFLQQLHCIPASILQAGKVFGHLRKLQDEKLIRHWGVSVETSEEALLCLEQEGISSLQIIFNLFRQHTADEVFEKADKKGVALIVRVPLASGLPTGKFTEHTKFAEKDHRNYNANGAVFNAGETFSGIEYSTGLQYSKNMAKLMPDDRMASWAIRWILDHAAVTTVIPGASKVEQVNTNNLASSLPPLPLITHQKLRVIYDEKVKPVIRGHY